MDPPSGGDAGGTLHYATMGAMPAHNPADYIRLIKMIAVCPKH